VGASCSHRDRKLVSQWAAGHTHRVEGTTPILALDPMDERSYHLDCGAAAAKDVDAFMKKINWTNVARLHQARAR
jgi:superoxide dismutase, Fe-Mn family